MSCVVASSKLADSESCKGQPTDNESPRKYDRQGFTPALENALKRAQRFKARNNALFSELPLHPPEGALSANDRASAERAFTLRRELILSVAALTLLPPSRAQALTPVRLMALRAPGLSATSSCLAPCIRGRLYDISDIQGPLDQVMPALVRLRPGLCDLIERPWKGNQPNKSAIRSGIYAATVRADATKPWMTSPDRAWRLELSGTAPRSAIQFHYGQDVGWSEGCFIVGRLLQSTDGAGITPRYCKVEDGEAAVARIRAAVQATGRSNRIEIAVADDAGLFANLSGVPPC